MLLIRIFREHFLGHARPKVLKAMERMVDACLATGVAPGIAASQGVGQFGIDYVNQMVAEGITFINVGGDLSLLTLGCKDFLGRIKL